MRQMLLAPLPLLATLALVVAAIVPWGGPDWSETALTLMPIGAIYFWSVRRPHLMPAALVFLIGCVLDVLMHGPLGIWAVAGLVAALGGRTARRARPPFGVVRSATHLITTMAAATTIGSGLQALSAWQSMTVMPLVFAITASIVTYPLVAGLLSLLDALWPAAPDRPLFLRGD